MICTEMPDPESYKGKLENRETIEALARCNGCAPLEFFWFARTIPQRLPGIYFVWSELMWNKGARIGFKLSYIGQSIDIKYRLSHKHSSYKGYTTELIGVLTVANQEKRECLELDLIGYLNPPRNITGRTDLDNGGTE